ncbi:MAG: hypothetical protein WC460_03485 [Patescibacteria group bacterium]
MKKFKITTLIIALFIIVTFLCLAIIVKAEDPGNAKSNESNINAEKRANINENRNLNESNQNLNENRNLNESNRNVNENENDNLNENSNQNANENVNENKGENKGVTGAEHRSAVATFVQNLLNAANNDKSGIGDQVKAIAQAQNDTKEQEAQAIDKINSRGKITTFLIGSDYKNLGMLRSQMVTTQNQINQLTALLAKTTDPATKASLQAQIQVLTQEQQKINDFIKTNESKFSLFGWLVKLFNK